jgi:hypothetical protein
MNCWKTINVKKQYGFDRIFLLSSIAVLTVFTVFHIIMGMIDAVPFSDRLFPLFTATFFLIYPIHKSLHFIPLIRYREHVDFSVKKLFVFVPVLSLFVKEPVPKFNFVLSLLMPFVVLNTVLLAGAYALPAFAHYFSILLAFHCGLCLIDLIYVKHLVRSPKTSLVEETAHGYEILIPPSE